MHTWPHALNWFEIPAIDLDRAFLFYHTILGGHVRKGTFGNGALVLFDVPFATGEAVGGALVVRPDLIPVDSGPILYLNTFGQFDACLSRVEPAGGSILVGKQDLGKFGYSAVIRDCEGNRIGLHQNTR